MSQVQVSSPLIDQRMGMEGTEFRVRDSAYGDEMMSVYMCRSSALMLGARGLSSCAT